MVETPRWRVGRRVGRTIYLNDELIGVMDTPELAAYAVRALIKLDEQEGERSFKEAE